MRLSLRFVVPLLIALAAFAYAVVPLVDKLTLKWFSRDLDIRANFVANAVEEPLQELIPAGNRRRILQFFTRMTQDERLLAVGFCPLDRSEPIATPTFPKEVSCATLDRFANPSGGLLQTEKGPVNVSVRPLAAAQPEASDSLSTAPLVANLGRLVLVHDMSFIARRSRETREYLFLFFVGLGLTVAGIRVCARCCAASAWCFRQVALVYAARAVPPPSCVRSRRTSGP
jgi:trehalose 6-phosphate synthase